MNWGGVESPLLHLQKDEAGINRRIYEDFNNSSKDLLPDFCQALSVVLYLYYLINPPNNLLK